MDLFSDCLHLSLFIYFGELAFLLLFLLLSFLHILKSQMYWENTSFVKAWSVEWDCYYKFFFFKIYYYTHFLALEISSVRKNDYFIFQIITLQLVLFSRYFISINSSLSFCYAPLFLSGWRLKTLQLVVAAVIHKGAAVGLRICMCSLEGSTQFSYSKFCSRSATKARMHT